MLQFDAAPVATSIPFFVNGKEFLSLDREMLGDMRRGRETSSVRWEPTQGHQSFISTTTEAATEAALRHVAGGGSTSGARGVESGCAPGSSTCNLRSAAFAIRAAETIGSLVALANLKRIAA